MDTNPVYLRNQAKKFGLNLFTTCFKTIQERIKRKTLEIACGEQQKWYSGTRLVKSARKAPSHNPNYSLWRLYIPEGTIVVLYDHVEGGVVRVVAGEPR